MGEIIYQSLKGIFGRKLRIFLTIMGIAVGVAAVIITSNISQCGSNALNNEIEGLGMSGLSITQKNKDAPLTKNELENIKAMPGVEYAMPLIFETTNVSLYGKENEIYLWGIDQSAEKAISVKLLYGRFLNSGDIAAGTRNCIVDQKFALDNYGTDNIVGKKINIISGGASAKYNVIGIIKTGSGLLQNIMGTYIPNFIYIPYTTMQSNLSSNNFTQIIIKTHNTENYDEMGKNIVKSMEREVNIRDAYVVTNLAKQKDSIDSILNIFTIVLSCVGAISLFVAGLSIMNVMLVSVTERTREIGIKKAIGASGKSILIEFLAESAVISLTGSLSGLIFGTGVSYLGAFLFHLELTPRIDIIIASLTFSVITGIIFGIYPAVKAAKLKPVDALRFY